MKPIHVNNFFGHIKVTVEPVKVCYTSGYTSCQKIFCKMDLIGRVFEYSGYTLPYPTIWVKDVYIEYDYLPFSVFKSFVLYLKRQAVKYKHAVVFTDLGLAQEKKYYKLLMDQDFRPYPSPYIKDAYYYTPVIKLEVKYTPKQAAAIFRKKWARNK